MARLTSSRNIVSDEAYSNDNKYIIILSALHKSPAEEIPIPNM